MTEQIWIRCEHCGQLHARAVRECPRTGRAISPRRISRRVRASSELPALPKVPPLGKLPRLWTRSSTGDAPSAELPAALPAVLPLAIGDVLDDTYEVVRVLGAGAMGTVFEGRNRRLDKRVAIKALHGSVASNPTMMRRFRREARIAGSLGHPNVCKVYDLAETRGGMTYLVMELLEGETLEKRLQTESQLTIHDACALGIAMLAGLEAAHGAGVVHRDIKPANVFLAEVDGGACAKLIDFGLSKADAAGNTQLTRVGHLIGTPAYMAPEQARGLEVDHRTDLYATGVVLYECLTGKPPFEARTLDELLVRVRQGLRTTVRSFRADVPQKLDEVILHATQPRPERRPRSAAEMQRALREVLAEEPAPISISISLEEGALTEDEDDRTEVRPPKFR